MLKNKELAKKAFTHPVRSVLFIDDQFPTYEELAAGTGDTRLEKDRAKRLMTSCRQHRYVCDVQNNPETLKDIELGRIGVSDLIVVDYHLRGDDGHNDDVLNFLPQVARSPHFNLVVLYTKAKALGTVRLNVAARLRGEPVPQSVEESDPAVPLPEITIPSAQLLQNVDGYLRNPRALGGQVSALFGANAAAVNQLGERKHALIRRNFESYLEEALGTKNYTGPKNHLNVTMSAADQQDQWVQAGNVFVAIMTKPEADAPNADSIDTLIQKLTDCIVDWSPSLIDVMLTAAAGSILRCGLQHSNFADANLRAGLVYWFLAGGSAYGDLPAGDPEKDRRIRVETLYRAVFEVLNGTALKQAADLSDEATKAALGAEDPAKMASDRHFTLAKEWAKGQGLKEEEMLLAANCFLCASSFEGGYISTGALFRKVGSDEYWLCVSAACDMVPREQSANKWRKQMFPLRMMLAAQLNKLASAASALGSATRGRHVFAYIDGKSTAFEFSTETSPDPQLVPFFAGNAATVVDRKFKASLLVKTAANILGIEEAEFEPVAQLRDNYSSRLLQQSGQYMSRIGVDFLDRPKPASPGKKASTAAGSAPPVGAPAKTDVAEKIPDKPTAGTSKAP